MKLLHAILIIFLGANSLFAQKKKNTLHIPGFIQINDTLFVSRSEVTIEEYGDTTTMYRGGSPVYIKVNDSVLINFIDSAKIDWNSIERIRK